MMDGADWGSTPEPQIFLLAKIIPGWVALCRQLAAVSCAWSEDQAKGAIDRRDWNTIHAVAESFFQLLKREWIKKKIYETREEARSDIFDYIEMFYNSKRRHGSSNQMSPTEYEKQYYQRLGSV